VGKKRIIFCWKERGSSLTLKKRGEERETKGRKKAKPWEEGKISPI